MIELILEDACEAISEVEAFFSVARTIPLVAMRDDVSNSVHQISGVLPLIPREVTPWFTAFNAYSDNSDISQLCSVMGYDSSLLFRPTYLDKLTADLS